MKIYVLASGSKGNMTYIKNDTMSFFIDAGISYQKVIKKMNDYKEDIKSVNTLFLTHEHSDHIIGLKALLKNGNIHDVYLTKGTLDSLPGDVRVLLPRTIIIKADELIEVLNFKITPIMLSHDAKEPVGFKVEKDSKSFVLLTDTGYVDESYIEILKDADLYLLESNHDPKKLLNSSRPFGLKKRILGITGHLSNLDASILMNQLTKDKKAIWIVGHISDDCNDHFDIEKAIVDNFENPLQVEVVFASQESLEGIEL